MGKFAKKMKKHHKGIPLSLSHNNTGYKSKFGIASNSKREAYYNTVINLIKDLEPPDIFDISVEDQDNLYRLSKTPKFQEYMQAIDCTKIPFYDVLFMDFFNAKDETRNGNCRVALVENLIDRWKDKLSNEDYTRLKEECKGDIVIAIYKHDNEDEAIVAIQKVFSEDNNYATNKFDDWCIVIDDYRKYGLVDKDTKIALARIIITFINILTLYAIPTLKNVVVRDDITSLDIMHTRKSKKKHNKSYDPKKPRVLKLIRNVYINENTIERFKREFTRHIDAWYVMGHWRQYKSGKKVWIKGYWKGENKDKKNSELKRIREVSIDEINKKLTGE